MVRQPKFGQRRWRFSDSGNKFNGNPRQARRSTAKPISPALKRGIIHCKRCGSRVVSNVANCPFCGRALRPVYARFWFWLIVVIAVAAGVVGFVNLNLPVESTAPSSPVEPNRPQVVDQPQDSAFKELPLGTTINNSGLLVTVTSISPGPVTANGLSISVLEIEFINQTDKLITLYSTQWMLQLNDGTRVDTFVGAAADGATIASNFEAYELAAQGRFSGRLYFAIPQSETAGDYGDSEDTSPAVSPSMVLYQPSALAYSEELLVTWLL